MPRKPPPPPAPPPAAVKRNVERLTKLAATPLPKQPAKKGKAK